MKARARFSWPRAAALTGALVLSSLALVGLSLSVPPLPPMPMPPPRLVAIAVHVHRSARSRVPMAIMRWPPPRITVPTLPSIRLPALRLPTLRTAEPPILLALYSPVDGHLRLPKPALKVAAFIDRTPMESGDMWVMHPFQFVRPPRHTVFSRYWLVPKNETLPQQVERRAMTAASAEVGALACRIARIFGGCPPPGMHSQWVHRPRVVVVHVVIPRTMALAGANGGHP